MVNSSFNHTAMSPQNELEACLINASKDQGQSYHFYETLLKSEIYFLSHADQRSLQIQEKLVDTSSSMQISIMQIEIEKQVYTSFFSSSYP